MSEKRTKKSKSAPMHEMQPVHKPSCCDKEQCCVGVGHLFCNHYSRLIIGTLVGILLAYVIIYFGTLIRNNMKTHQFIGQADLQPATIVVEGVGEVTARPDIAKVNMGVTTEDETVEKAQQKNSQKMNLLLDSLKKLEISEEDIQTNNYNVYPRYDYNEEEGRVLRGHEVSQNVEVKIRDLDKANTVLALAGEIGINNVGGLDFILDDPSVYKDSARSQAINNVQQKAFMLANQLGGRLGRVVSFSEEQQGSFFPQARAFALEESNDVVNKAPQLESGSMDVVVKVFVTYEILQ